MVPVCVFTISGGRVRAARTRGAKARIEPAALRSPFDFTQGRPLKRRSSTLLRRPNSRGEPSESSDLVFVPRSGLMHLRG